MTAQQYIENENVIVRVSYALPTTVRACCYSDKDGTEYILVNGYLSETQRKKSVQHEVNHLIRGELCDPEYVEYQ